MFKGLKKKVLSTVISLAFILTLVPAIPVAANGGAPTSYITLGDSVSYGMSAVIPEPPYYKYGYTNMLYDYLNNNTFPYLTFGLGQPDGFNLSVPGAVSSDLLNVISNNESLIHDTNLISINIGGNNLLKPFTRALFSLYGLVGTYNDGTLTTEQKFATLAAAISSDPDPGATMARLLEPADPVAKKLNKDMAQGVKQFNQNWPVIMKKIRAINPEAVVVVNTIYNPISSASDDTLSSELRAYLDTYIAEMNDTISDNDTVYGYGLADVYTAFINTTDYNGGPVLTFNIPLAIAAAQSGDPLFISYIDIHPSIFGHILIYETIFDELFL